MNKQLSRRTVLAGGAAAGWAVMQRARAQGSAANERIKAGVIGLGGRGRMITGMLKEHGGYAIAAVADYFPEVVKGVGEQYGVPPGQRFNGLDGYKGLIASGVDAVFLETPPYCFPEHVEAAVTAGLHVYMAKPVACDAPGCVAVRAAADRATRAGRVFLVDFQTRTDPFNIEGIERVHKGEIGAIGLLSSIYTDEAFADPPFTANVESRLQGLIWVNDVALGGGYLVNAGIHAVDVGLWLAGEPPVSAVGASRVVRADPHGDSRDVYSLTYTFANGLVLNHRGEHLKNRYGFSCECRAYCQDGYLDATYGGQVRMLGNSAGWRGGEVKDLYQRGARHNIAWFHDCVLEGDASNPTVTPSIDATLATILGREAALRQERLTWDGLIAENKRIEPDLTGLKA